MNVYASNPPRPFDTTAKCLVRRQIGLADIIQTEMASLTQLYYQQQATSQFPQSPPPAKHGIGGLGSPLVFLALP